MVIHYEFDIQTKFFICTQSDGVSFVVVIVKFNRNNGKILNVISESFKLIALVYIGNLKCVVMSPANVIEKAQLELNNDYNELIKAGYDYVEGTLVPQPIARPQFSLTELRNAIPSHCFERSMVKSFGYLALDFVYVSLLASCAYVLLEERSVYWQLIGYPIYWFCQGSVLFGVWVMAHECGHSAFSENDLVNDTVGWIVHSALLTPYHSWKISHRKHHANTGSCEHDLAFVPFTHSELEATWSDALEDSSLYHVYKIFKVLLIGWMPGYLGFNGWGPRKYANGPKCHFNPKAKMFAPKERHLIVLSDVGVLLTMVAIGCFISTYGFPIVLRMYFVPYLVMNAYLVTVTYLHHTDTYVPHFREGKISNQHFFFFREMIKPQSPYIISLNFFFVLIK